MRKILAITLMSFASICWADCPILRAGNLVPPGTLTLTYTGIDGNNTFTGPLDYFNTFNTSFPWFLLKSGTSSWSVDIYHSVLEWHCRDSYVYIKYTDAGDWARTLIYVDGFE